MKLCELLDYIWPNKVALYFGKTQNNKYIQLQCIQSNVFDLAEANHYYPDFEIYDIYADRDYVVIALSKKNSILPLTKQNHHNESQ